MLYQPAEVKREVLSLILGDLDEFKKLVETRETLNLCGKQWMQESANPLSQAISKKVSQIFKSSAKEAIKAKLESDLTPFHLLSDSIPSECIDVEKGLRVREQKWDEWLQICWGHDHDTLSMLSMLPMFRYAESSKQFVEDVEKLPIIQSPVGSEQLKDIVDSHTHSGSLYPPSLQWAHCINTGISVETLLSNEDKFWCVPDVESYKKKYRTTYLYLSVARVLLGALLDFYQLISISSDNILLGNKVDVEILPALVEKVMQLISLNEDNLTTREELQVLIRKGLPELKDNQLKMLDRSIQRGESFQDKDNVYSFLQTERKCIATLLWQAYHNKLGIFLQEVLLTYLRCKGAWFQRNSGNNLETSELLEYILFKSYHLSSVTSDTFTTFHSPMSEAIKQFYKNSNYLDNQYLKKVEVRLPCLEKMNLERTINWLCSVYNNVNWGLVLSFPRYSYEKQERNIKHLHEYYLEFINNILDDNRVNDRVCGIDIVGINQNINWQEYAILIKELREHIEKQKKKNCFITYHFSEDMKEISLKEICEVWTIINDAELKEGDRISHGLGLLSPTINMTEGKTTMNRTEWELIRDSIERFTDTLPNKDEIRSLYKQFISNKTIKEKVVELDNAVMSELAASLQQFVKEKLIKENILLEICPTSSWRIAGIPLPTKHPVKSWIEAEGKILIGTDNPSVFPCTIESEYYSLQRLMEQPNMPYNSQPKYKYDVFISHASEDKKEFVDDLAEKLKGLGYDVWYDKDVLIIGDSLSSSIDKGISDSQYGIIVLSPHSIKRDKEWIQRELKGLIEKEKQGQKVLLPIWHKVSPEEIQKFSNDFAATLTDESKVNIADKFAVQSSEDLSPVVNQIVKVLGTPKNPTQKYLQKICVNKLAQMENNELYELMKDSLDIDDVSELWYSTLGETMRNSMPGQGKNICFESLIDKANNKGIDTKKKFIELLCKKRSNVTKP